MIATSIYLKLFIFTSFASARPLFTSSESHPNSLLVTRARCPAISSLPINWDATGAPVKACGWSSCLPWNRNKQKGIGVDFVPSKSTGGDCIYSIASWNGQPAYVLTPIKVGKKTPERQRYDEFIAMSRKLGRVLAETKRPAAVLVQITGMPIQQTTTWTNFFDEASRPIPSDQSYQACVALVTRAHRLARNRMVDYAQNSGLEYAIDAWDFESTKWSHDWSHVEFVGWTPAKVTPWPPNTAVPQDMKAEWLKQIAHKDLRATSGKYVNDWTLKMKNIRGVCDYFNQSPSSGTSGESDSESDWLDSTTTGDPTDSEIDYMPADPNSPRDDNLYKEGYKPKFVIEGEEGTEEEQWDEEPNPF